MRSKVLVSLFSAAVLLLSGSLFADTCEDRADRDGRIAYQSTYNRVLQACQGGGDECRFNADCSFDQVCHLGQCVTGGSSEQCIKRCSARNGNGSCYQYAPDFCGFNPVCTPNCTARNANGSCYQYGIDHCGRAPLACVARCVARHANGSCYQYSADYCGLYPTCSPSCVARNGNGTCYQYEPDRCSGGQ